MKLHQLLAVEGGAAKDLAAIQAQVKRALTNKATLSGLTRTYRPILEDGEQLPAESTKVQVTAVEAVGALNIAFRKIADMVGRHEATNQVATAPVVLADGTVLAEDMPVTALLWWEKRLTEMLEFVASLPVLDPAQEWAFDPTTGQSKAATITTVRSKKIPRFQEVSPATPQHPAQIHRWDEDVAVGYWDKTDFSGAFPQTVVNDLHLHLRALIDAVKSARQAANSVDVVTRTDGAAASMLEYLFRPVL